MVSRQQRYFTTFVRVQKWKVLQVEIHPMSGANSSLPWWFEDRHLQEVLQLLKGTIFERVKLKRQEVTKNMTKSEIATGTTVRIGYVFRPKPEYQICLLPTSQPLYTSDSDSDNEDQNPRYQYRNLSLHHEKLVVYTCLLKEATTLGSMAQILSAIGENSPQPKSISISSYFNRVVPPAISSHSSQTSSSTADSNKELNTEFQSQRKTAARPSDPRKRKLKCIIKRSGSKLSRKAKKMKPDTNVATLTSSCCRDRSETNQDNKENCDNDEFSRLSFYGDLPLAENRDSNTEVDTNEKINVIEANDGDKMQEENGMFLISAEADKKYKMKTVSGQSKYLNKSNDTDLFEEQIQERDEMCDASDEVNFIEDDKQRSIEKDNSLSVAKDADLRPDVSDKVDVATDSDTSELSLYLVETPSPTPQSLQHDVNTELPPVKNMGACSLLPRQSNIDAVTNASRFDVNKNESSTNQFLRCSDVDKEKQASSDVDKEKQASSDVDKEKQASSHVDKEKQASSHVDKKKQASNHVDKEKQARKGNVKDDGVSEDLPKISLKRRDRSWRKSLALMMTESPALVKPAEEEVIDCEKINCELLEDLAQLPKHKMCLTSNFRQELEQISHESQLTESQIEKMVLGSKDYLYSIFMGKHQSRRHTDYKKGGTARFNLNYQVNLGMFTEAQQDAVMDALMTIFCKRHHKYMDYILKVLLPEMMIWILMEVKNTTYEETESLMSGCIM